MVNLDSVYTNFCNYLVRKFLSSKEKLFMIEVIIIVFLIWFLVGTIRFLFSLENVTSLMVQLTGIDWVLSGLFYVVLWVVTKIRSHENL
jgi:hypothetical protein